MTQHPAPERLQEYLDDLLCREERAELEAHLAGCAQCTAAVVAERELRRALADLPRSIAPERDLLAGINAAIDAATAVATGLAGQPSEQRPVRFAWGGSTLWRRRTLAAAALVLVALTALVTMLPVRRPDAPPLAEAPARAQDPVVREVLATEPSYRAAIAELEAALAASPALDTATSALVRENLAVIDRALAEAAAARRQLPNDPSLARLLRHARAQKLELLRAATRGRT